jgi:hypothetical protein
VLYSHNNLGWFQYWLGGFGFHRWNKPMGGPVKDRLNQPACAEPEIPSLSPRYPQRKKAAATSAAA